MPIAVIMPKFEMTQETGTVGSWLKAEGDFVRKGEPILEIETDKVSMEVESPADGTLVGISAGHGPGGARRAAHRVPGARGRDVASPGKRTRAARRQQPGPRTQSRGSAQAHGGGQPDSGPDGHGAGH